MRILHVYRAYAPITRGGGVERYIHQLSLASIALGHNVRVAAQTVDDAAMSYPVMRANWRVLRAEIRAADIVHIHGPRTAYAALAAALAWVVGTPFVYTIHCFYRGKNCAQSCSKFFWDHLVERMLMLRARRVILLSEHWRAYVAARALPTARVAILPNGIDVAALRNEEPPTTALTGNPALLSVCRLDPVKRIEDMIAALKVEGMEKAHLHIVGGGDDSLRLQEIAATHKVSSRVTFYGFQSDARIAAMARAAHVFIIASAEEGMPTTILEMLARELPVVASEIPGNLSLTAPLGWNFTYKLADVNALAQAVQKAYGTRISDAVMEKLTALFDWKNITCAMLACYGEN